MPSFARCAYLPLIYPPHWPLALLQKIVAPPPMFWLLIYYFLGGLFAYLLAREWGARAEGALLGAAAFVFAPNLVAVGSHGHGSQLVDSAYIPLLLWLAARWIKRGRLSDLGWLALAGGFQMLRGHAQIAFYTWFAVGLLVGVDLLVAVIRPSPGDTPLPVRIARAVGIGAAMALAFGLAGFYNLPLRDYAHYSIRGSGADGGVGMDYATAWSFAPYELLSVLIPGAVGFGGETYWGAMPFTDYPNPYLGIVAVLIALPLLLVPPKRADATQMIFALLLAVISMAIAFGKHFPCTDSSTRMPLFNKFRIPVMIVVLFQMAAALATAWGWSRLLDESAMGAKRPALTGRVLLAVAAALVLALIVGVGARDAMQDGYVRSALAHREGFPAQVAALAYQRYVGDLGRACVLGLLAVGLMLLVRAGKLAGALASAAMLVLVLVELWPVSGEVMKPVIGAPTPNIADVGRATAVISSSNKGRGELPHLAHFRRRGLAQQSVRGIQIASVGYHGLSQDHSGLLPSRDGDADVAPAGVRFFESAAVDQLPPWLHQGSGPRVQNLTVLPR